MKNRLLGLALLLLVSIPSPAKGGARLKELVTLEGARENQLIGYGLVVGLAKTGDRRQTVFSAQSLANLLQRMGITVPPEALLVNNIAAVMVTATLPAYAQPGTRIDTTVAAIGDAGSLQGGLLLFTTLRGADGQVYATAQGPLVLGGYRAGIAGNNATVNHPTVGRIPAGAIVERPAPSVPPQERLKLQLRHADFSTAARVAAAVNEKFGGEGESVAVAENSAVVAVDIPEAYLDRRIEFIAQLETLSVEADRVAKVVINERTGTIVMGREVRISAAVIMHGNLTVEIQTVFDVSQPPPLSGGTTQVVPEVSVGVKEQAAKNLVLKDGANVEELVRALASICSELQDIIAILENLRSAGALEADIEVI